MAKKFQRLLSLKNVQHCDPPPDFDAKGENTLTTR